MQFYQKGLNESDINFFNRTTFQCHLYIIFKLKFVNILLFMVFFETFRTCSVTGKIHIKVQHFRVKVTFYLLQVGVIVFLYLSAAVEKITILGSAIHPCGIRYTNSSRDTVFMLQYTNIECL